MKKKIAIIGSGFSSLSAASYLAKENYEVHVFEKNSTLGGRARQLKKNGFTFDMGPSWYWMQDVFESFYNDFGKTTSDLYQLERLDPGYQVVFGENKSIPIGDSLEKIYTVFEKYGVPKRPFVPELIQVCLACTNMKVAYISCTLVFGKEP